MLKIRILILLWLGSATLTAQYDYSKYVNPFIGTGGHGHTYPGATVPHGMVQLSPDTRLEGWDGCSGYHYSDSFIYGFSHTHLSGTGVSDFGDILVMPVKGKPSPDNRVYGSSFSHSNEDATAGYYSVKLDDDHIMAEFTATERVGYHHYFFSAEGDNNIILDLKHRDEVIESSLSVEDSVTVTGMRRSRAWADNQYVFFVMKFSAPISKFGIWEDDSLLQASTKKVERSKNLKAFFTFVLNNSEEIYVRVAISPVSIAGAKKNLDAETTNKSFAEIKKEAQTKWNRELSKIEIESNDSNKLKIFYTALYHTAIVPNINMDADSFYRGRDDKIHKAVDFTYYSVFSLWDTYRAAHPLYTIIDRVRTLDYIKTFLAQYQEGGRLPVWELAACETDCMIGYHSIPVITDAFAKGITLFDTKLAMEAMKRSATWDHFGLKSYQAKGMIETDDEQENVSRTLEYAYDDWCIAMFAKLTGDKAGYAEYIKRSQYYKNLLESQSGFMRPKTNGDWQAPFDPREVNNNYTEANSWQYSFSMPHDIQGYLKLTGGSRKLEERLNKLFSETSQTTGSEQSDITGLIGQYAHGNEPSHHIIYLYNYARRPNKAQQLIHKVLNEMYLNTPDGLIGNEDCGQMSAWYVLSSMGFYPLTPGSSDYVIGSPQFSKVKIHLENGSSFNIQAPMVSNKNIYVRNASLSTTADSKLKKMTSFFLLHQNIAGGGLLEFTMDNQPSDFFSQDAHATNDGVDKENTEIILNPVIHGGDIAFRKSKTVSLSAAQQNVKIFYTLDDKDPLLSGKQYRYPVIIDSSLTLKAIAVNIDGRTSFVTTAVYKKIPNNWTIKLNTNYEQQYSGGGASGLIDGIHGTTNWRKGNWQGYQQTDVDVVIDLQSVQKISKVSLGFLQDSRAWILMPREIIVEVSTDGKEFEQVYRGNNFLSPEDLNVQVKDIQTAFPLVPAKFIRVKALQYGKLPAWHPGAGGDTHIFLDEITVQ